MENTKLYKVIFNGKYGLLDMTKYPKKREFIYKDVENAYFYFATHFEGVKEKALEELLKQHNKDIDILSVEPVDIALWKADERETYSFSLKDENPDFKEGTWKRLAGGSTVGEICNAMGKTDTYSIQNFASLLNPLADIFNKEYYISIR